MQTHKLCRQTLKKCSSICHNSLKDSVNTTLVIQIKSNSKNENKMDDIMWLQSMPKSFEFKIMSWHLSAQQWFEFLQDHLCLCLGTCQQRNKHEKYAVDFCSIKFNSKQGKSKVNVKLVSIEFWLKLCMSNKLLWSWAIM